MMVMSMRGFHRPQRSVTESVYSVVESIISGKPGEDYASVGQQQEQGYRGAPDRTVPERPLYTGAPYAVPPTPVTTYALTAAGLVVLTAILFIVAFGRDGNGTSR